jgi:hypothetical protein
MRCICIKNTTGKTLMVKEAGNSGFETVLPNRGQMANVDVDAECFERMKESGAYIKVDLSDIRESRGKQYLKG